MIIYFAVDKESLKESGLSKDSDRFIWELNFNSFLNGYIGNNSGDVLNTIKTLQSEFKYNEPFVICKAHVKDEDAIEALRASLVGDSMTCQVEVLETTWID